MGPLRFRSPTRTRTRTLTLTPTLTPTLTLTLTRPDEDEWGLSDHGVVTSTFVAQRRGEAEVTAWIQERSGAEDTAAGDA